MKTQRSADGNGRILHYVSCILLVALTTLLGEIVKRRLEPTNIAMLYLLVVVIASVRWGKGPAIVTSILGVLSFDFFLVPPYLTFSVASIHYIFTFIGLLVVGLVISTLASRMREQTRQAQRQEARTAALYRLTDDLAGSETFESALQAVQQNVGRILNCAVAIYVYSGKELVLRNSDADFPIDEHEKEIARSVAGAFESKSGIPASARRESPRYYPLNTPRGVLGVLGISVRKSRGALSADEEYLLGALMSQAAVAIQRAKLSEESRQIELMRQTEKLQSALLSSISHDLRTPLVSVTGALTALMDTHSGLDDTTRKELLETASGEADRLNRLVGNLLDMTRMEAGALRVTKRPCELRDVVGASLEQLKEKVGRRTVAISIPGDFPEIPMDFALMMKVFFNLIDNAVKYSPEDAPIDITARVSRDRAIIEIRDRGIGILESDLKRVFEKFYRAERPHRVTGTGLGLSICRGIIEAHGGDIVARGNPDGGATFVLALPVRSE